MVASFKNNYNNCYAIQGNIMIKSFLRVLAASAALAAPALAQDFPNQPVRVVVPYNAGGTVDYVGRVTAAEMGKLMGENFVVENRPGASASIGNQFVANAAPDGYTLLMTSVTSNAITTGLTPETAGYALKDDFTPVGAVGRVPLMLVAANNVPADTIEELIEYAKAEDLPLTYASSGIGSTEHLGAMVFADAAGLELEHIPYTGGAPAMADLVAGRVSLMVATVSTALPQVEANAIKPMVVAMPDRIDMLPDVPSASDAGLDGFNVASVYGLLAPVGIDEAALTALKAALQQTVAGEAFVTQMGDRGIVPSTDAPEDAATIYEAEIDTWAERILAVDFD
ncbi:tripartite tricarboxylate transporter substrate binding protein [Salipiger sp. HF18]|nr:tripartite tricarboxylate transporter substrate binding protein [Salipiger sp. HF18]